MFQAQAIAFLIIVPFVAIFVYAGWHEYKRYKSEGKSAYGLTYDPETNTTHVGAIPDEEDSYDPEEFEPELTDAIGTEDPDSADAETDRTETDDQKQETRT